jgi:hypothetical protein
MWGPFSRAKTEFVRRLLFWLAVIGYAVIVSDDLRRLPSAEAPLRRLDTAIVNRLLPLRRLNHRSRLLFLIARCSK